MGGIYLKICVAQTDIVWENKAENFRKCRRFTEQAAEHGSRLIVFPELSLTGFTMNRSLAEAPDGETVQRFSELSRESGIAVGFGFACKQNDRITNRFCIADNGAVIAQYDKLHPFSYGGECAVYSPGDKLVTAEISGETLGLTVCYDLRFPEIYQKLSETCSLIIVIANWPDSRSDHWKTLLKARAIENQCFIAGCNRCGNGGGLDYSGDSAVYSPAGELAAASEPYREQLIYAEISREECWKIQNGFPVKKDRRFEIYRDFYVK